MSKRLIARWERPDGPNWIELCHDGSRYTIETMTTKSTVPAFVTTDERAIAAVELVLDNLVAMGNLRPKRVL
jgi:hypothetical protein